jgi:hypothetical protein
MATQQAKTIAKTDYAPPPIEGDFYRIAAVMNESERALLKRVREFTEGVIAPVIEDYWSRDAFPSRSSRRWQKLVSEGWAIRDTAPPAAAGC